MEVYLVGGAVRDCLLGRPVSERDWVVVGATPQMMLNLGFQPVGKDFPVFLHPETHDEYALARTERKTKPGYTGFVFYAAPEVTLAEDLSRRDLTINAMAQDMEGHIIDPYGGQADLSQRIFRHVSPAFVEDPVRILRVARFSARFSDFTIAQETAELMRQIVKRGEVDVLVAERVWQEWDRALLEPAPQRFFSVLTQCGALDILFPELADNDAGWGILEKSTRYTDSALIRFAVSLSGIDKSALLHLFKRYRIPKNYQQLALLVAVYHATYLTIQTAALDVLLQLLEQVDAFRRPQRFEQFLMACHIIEGHPSDASTLLYLRQAYALTKSVDPTRFVAQGLSGTDIRDALYAARLRVLTESL